MQDTRTNQLETAATLDELKRRIPPEDRGPVFHDGEIVNLKGYLYRIDGLSSDGMTLRPHGKAPKQFKPRRRGQRR